MAELGFDFSYTADDLKDEYQPLPEDTYTVEVVDSEIRAMKEGDGKYIRLRLRVTSGTYENRIFFNNISVPDKDAQTEEQYRKAVKMLGQLCNAVGMPEGFQLKNTLDLHNVEIKASVYVTKPKNGYGPGNKIGQFSAMGTGSPVVAAQQTQAPAKPAAPWKR